jgi:phosphonate transport system substrate-binding protein
MILPRPLRFVSFLAPNLTPLYRFLARRVQEVLGIATEFRVGTCYQELRNQAEIAFLCGLAYIELKDEQDYPIEALAAPVLEGQRYADKPLYFSDVVVRQDSPYRSFLDLRGKSWSFNEPRSQSGYGITRHHLVCLGETEGFFGQVIEAGWHARSLRMVLSGSVDASAIDSQVLALTLKKRPHLARQLRILDTLGPSTIQPVTVACWLPDQLKRDLAYLFVNLAHDPTAQPYLREGMIARFTAISDRNYDDLREMRTGCLQANFLALR